MVVDEVGWLFGYKLVGGVRVQVEFLLVLVFVVAWGLVLVLEQDLWLF